MKDDQGSRIYRRQMPAKEFSLDTLGTKGCRGELTLRLFEGSKHSSVFFNGLLILDNPV